MSQAVRITAGMESKMKRLLFIYNPLSGKGMIKDKLSDIVDKFIKSGYRVETYATQKSSDAKDKAFRWAEDFDMIVCSGGDGTLNEIVSGIMELDERPTIGYIPSGSTNDFASSIMLPKDMLEAADIAMQGTPLDVDIGGFNKKKFVYIAAFGAFTDVSYMTPQEMKNVLGHPAYIIEAVKGLSSLRTYHLKLDLGDKLIEGDYMYGMITNSISVGGFKGITGKDVILDDGKFEVTLIRAPKNPIELQVIIASLIGMDVKCESVESYKTSRVEITTDEKIPWVLDGEYGGAPKKIVIRNYHQAVRIMTGRDIV